MADLVSTNDIYIAFYAIKNDHYCLPKFFNEKDWLVAAPDKDQKYPEHNSEEGWKFDAKFMKWYYKYGQLFGNDRELHMDLNLKIEKVKLTDEWRVMNQGALNRMLETKHQDLLQGHTFELA